MGTEVDPVVGRWYRHLDKGLSFEVVALDETAEIAEIQFIDGDVDEIDLDVWYEQDIEPIAEPEEAKINPSFDFHCWRPSD